MQLSLESSAEMMCCEWKQRLQDKDKENKRESVNSEQNSSNMQEELMTWAHNLKKTMKAIEHLASAQKNDAEQ